MKPAFALLWFGKPEGEDNADGWFKAWAERRRDDAQGGLQLGEDVGDVGFVEG